MAPVRAKSNGHNRNRKIDAAHHVAFILATRRESTAETSEGSGEEPSSDNWVGMVYKHTFVVFLNAKHLVLGAVSLPPNVTR